MKFREETDSLGKMKIPEDALYGIHTLRAKENFPSSGEKIHPLLIHSYFQVKLASLTASFNLGYFPADKFSIVSEAITNLLEESSVACNGGNDSIYRKIVVDPYQGGAGTSLNMNINEVIANTSSLSAGREAGEYSCIHPIDDINLFQSTNDTFPTALKIAAIKLLRELAEAFAGLQQLLQEKENEFSDIIKLGRTQYQDAVPVKLGAEFGAYAQAISRDRWRLYNGEERLRSVNIGGTAVGTSVNAPKDYVLSVSGELKKITGLPIAKSEDLIDATQNLDVFVEVHGLIKSGAATLIKICNDLRLLSSGPSGGIGEIKLPPVQAGSSIMPGKVNPVIPEQTIQVCELVKGHDAVITNLVSSGTLELNSFMPLIAHLFLKSGSMLKDTVINLGEKCIKGIMADRKRCKENLLNSTAPAAVLINIFGYDKIAAAVKEADEKGVHFIDVLEANLIAGKEEVYKIISGELGI
jgi:aspartate ammonia-lyase